MGKIIGRKIIFNKKREIVSNKLMQENNKLALDYVNKNIENLSPKVPAYITLNRYLFSNLDTIENIKDKIMLEVISDEITLKDLMKVKDRGFILTLKFNDTKFDKYSDDDLDMLINICKEVHLSSKFFDIEDIKSIQSEFKNKTICIEDISTLENFYEYDKLENLIFEGMFFIKPEIIPGKRITSNTLNVIEVIKMLNQDEFVSNFKLEMKLKESPDLIFNLLKFINSAEFSFRKKITSISQVIALIGVRRLDHIIRLFIGTSQDSNKFGMLVSEKATIRGNIMELLAKKLDNKNREYAYITGIFSLMDSLFNVPIENIINSTNLHENIVNGLLDKTSDLGKLLLITKKLETFNEKDINEVSLKTSLSLIEIKYILNKAVFINVI